MRRLLISHGANLAAVSTPPSSTSSSSACNKQTINAGDNPCPPTASPIPYMLAGLAAMVLLVVISLLILACSYLRGYFAIDDSAGGGSGATSNAASNAAAKAASLHSSAGAFGGGDEKFLVILPGEAKPTHLAQPMKLPPSSPPLGSPQPQPPSPPPPPSPSLHPVVTDIPPPSPLPPQE